MEDKAEEEKEEKKSGQSEVDAEVLEGFRVPEVFPDRGIIEVDLKEGKDGDIGEKDKKAKPFDGGDHERRGATEKEGGRKIENQSDHRLDRPSEGEDLQDEGGPERPRPREVEKEKQGGDKSVDQRKRKKKRSFLFVKKTFRRHDFQSPRETIQEEKGRERGRPF